MITVKAELRIGTSNSVPDSRRHKQIVVEFTESVEYGSQIADVADRLAALLKDAVKAS